MLSGGSHDMLKGNVHHQLNLSIPVASALAQTSGMEIVRCAKRHQGQCFGFLVRCRTHAPATFARLFLCLRSSSCHPKPAFGKTRRLNPMSNPMTFIRFKSKHVQHQTIFEKCFQLGSPASQK